MYTSNSELWALLAASRFPGVSIKDITQTVDSQTLTVENRVEIAIPGARGSVSSTASFEVRSPKRLQIKFSKGTISTPTLDIDDVLLPASVNIMGQTIDLTPMQNLLNPIKNVASQAVSQISDVINNQPDLQLGIPEQFQDRTQNWLLTSYLDSDLRVARGDGGSVFIMTKQVEEEEEEDYTLSEPGMPPAAPSTGTVEKP